MATTMSGEKDLGAAGAGAAGAKGKSEFEALKADFATLREDFATLLKDTGKAARAQTGKSGEAAQKLAGEAGEKMSDYRNVLEKTVRDHPFAALGIALAAGFLVASVRPHNK